MNIKIQAPAKINLGLQVLGRRSDGFHNINTVFMKIPLFDEIEFENSENICLEIILNPKLNHSELYPNEENLIIQAANLLKKYNPEYSKFGANIKLYKNIPIGGGLGGGSSDAASALIGLNKLWNMNLSIQVLSEIGLELGSDVPFFINEEYDSAVGTSRGEILEYFDSNLQVAILLVNPVINISTKWGYESLNLGDRIFEPTDFKTPILKLQEDENILKARLYNDFEPVVFAKHPQISEIKEILYRKGALYAQMSGSGSTVFGLFRDLESTVKASKFIHKDFFVFSSLMRYLPV